MLACLKPDFLNSAKHVSLTDVALNDISHSGTNGAFSSSELGVTFESIMFQL